MAFRDDDREPGVVSEEALGEVLEKDEDEDEPVDIPPVVEEDEKGWE